MVHMIIWMTGCHTISTWQKVSWKHNSEFMGIFFSFLSIEFSADCKVFHRLICSTILQQIFTLVYCVSLVVWDLNMLKFTAVPKSKPLVSWQYICKVNNVLLSLAFPHSTSVTCYHFIVRYFGNTATCPWSRSSSCSSLAGLLLQRGLTITHGCFVATECDISMLSLKRLLPACSQCQLPLSSFSPHSPTDLDTVFLLLSSLLLPTVLHHTF